MAESEEAEDEDEVLAASAEDADDADEEGADDAVVERGGARLSAAAMRVPSHALVSQIKSLAVDATVTMPCADADASATPALVPISASPDCDGTEAESGRWAGRADEAVDEEEEFDASVSS